MIPRNKWRWHGDAGHFIAANSCRFYMHTDVGGFKISTVGDYHPGNQKERESIGIGRLFETFVFRTAETCTCESGCTHRLVSDWDEIDSLGANTHAEAERNHLAMCLKYAKLESAPDEGGVR